MNLFRQNILRRIWSTQRTSGRRNDHEHLFVIMYAGRTAGARENLTVQEEQRRPEESTGPIADGQGACMIRVKHSFDGLFRDARSKALLAALLDLIRRQPPDMLALADVRAGLNIRGQRALGRQSVPLTHIIGSEGRYHDFDRRFLPRTDMMQQRWSSIERVMVQGQALPPVDLYKISDVYFVRHGDHRAAVARYLDYAEIDAEVTELLVDVPLTPALSVRTLLLKQEYSDFLEWTNLHALRPDERIEFSELGGYLDLVRHINVHRYALAREQNRAIDRDEAVASWYDAVYLPRVHMIREQKLLKRFSHRTEADLYRWMVEQQQTLTAAAPLSPGSLGDPSISKTTLDRKRWADAVVRVLRRAMQRLRRWL